MNRTIWKDVRTEARELRMPRMSDPILGYDHDPSMRRLWERSASEAGVSGDIQFRIQEISELKSIASMVSSFAIRRMANVWVIRKKSKRSIVNWDECVIHFRRGAFTSSRPTSGSKNTSAAEPLVAASCTTADSNANTTNTSALPRHERTLKKTLLTNRPMSQIQRCTTNRSLWTDRRLSVIQAV